MPTQSEIDFLRRIGKCASVAPQEHGGWLCTLTANHQPRYHTAQIIGGPDDGKELAKWPW